MDDLNNDELIGRARRGDRDALNVLVNRWYPLVLGMFLHLSRDWHLAWDLAQDVFIVFCRNKPYLSTPNLAEPQLRAWMRTVAQRRWFHHVNGLQHRAWSLGEERLEELVDPGVGPAEKASQDELIARLRVHIQSLSPSQQELLQLRINEMLSYRQMAERLRVNEVTLRWRVSRVRNTLLQRIAKADPELSAWLDEISWAL